jgi:hypothetical protein
MFGLLVIVPLFVPFPPLPAFALPAWGPVSEEKQRILDAILEQRGELYSGS